jgi:hypothetical protein
MSIDPLLAGAYRSFFRANIVLLLNLLEDLPNGAALRELFFRVTRSPLIGNSELIFERWRDSTVNPIRDELPEVETVQHAFPVVVESLDVGMVVPMTCQPSEDWEASDAFTRFQVENTRRRPIQGLLELLEQIEEIWEAQAGHRKLPLRWRCPFSISLRIPVHAEEVAGRSLEFPLALMVLREACRQATGSIPFGDGPVFCSGSIEQGGVFGPVRGLRQKLSAFLREFGTGRAALLTTSQIEELSLSPVGRELLQSLTPIRVNDITRLVMLPELNAGLDSLSGPPDLAELDAMLGLVERLNRSIRFEDSRAITSYLLLSAKTPSYRLSLLSNAGLMLLHRGSTLAAWQYLNEAVEIISSDETDLGVDQRALCAAAIASGFFDVAEPDRGLALVESVRHSLGLCGHKTRASVLGAACQLHRVLGDWVRAIDNGEEAVAAAKAGYGSEVGRDINYLIHALIRFAWASPERAREPLIARARCLLGESQRTWSPIHRVNRESHLLFCKHFAAELDRLANQRHHPGIVPTRWQGTWQHPWLFVMLSIARNPSHDIEERREWARRLVALSFEASTETGREASLFELLNRVYRIYAAALEGGDVAEIAAELADWCAQCAAAGQQGWQRLLSTWAQPPPRGLQLSWAEALCDAIPFH